MSRSILRNLDNGSTYLVEPRLDPNDSGKQKIWVINGCWGGTFEDGKVTYSKGKYEIRNDFEDVGDYNQILQDFENKVKQSV